MKLTTVISITLFILYAVGTSFIWPPLDEMTPLLWAILITGAFTFAVLTVQFISPLLAGLFRPPAFITIRGALICASCAYDLKVDQYAAPLSCTEVMALDRERRFCAVCRRRI